MSEISDIPGIDIGWDAARGSYRSGTALVEWTDPATLIPWHETDPAKVGQLAASMAAGGWQGAPVVVDGQTLLTGHHRTAAARHAGIFVPVVKGEDILAAAGVDITEWTFAGWVAWEQAFDQVPRDLCDAYGIDL
jgi:hypothetical protein